MVAAYHAEEGIDSDEPHRRAGLGPLLEGSPLGAAYLIGPRVGPVGYIVLSFGWSLEFAGMDGFVDEFWIRPGVRGRGMGSEVLAALVPALEAAGLKALHLEAGAANARVQRLYARHGFVRRDGYHLMTRTAP
jgi:ribosomal protein S18 acetylase RimI-like enzyme